MPRKIRDALDAQACLDAAHSAGLAPKNWARQHDLDARSLNMWRVLLARCASRDSAPTPSQPRLVELVPASPLRSPARYVLHVAGCVVELGDDFHEASLARLLRVLRVLTLPPSVRVFVAVEPLGMRGSFDALAGAPPRPRSPTCDSMSFRINQG